ncbi:hypothetical protein A1O7_05010 [Cladophialophora yegresii CBS 114405]|uniref:Uncharacterized protein n=1 Tax=Cladophialophora yegresii CBS 114405 TaxID=1182544 RepID=W9VYH8_9EURO|nr:uncharacterized protein A1O7_05010 [Cladophialophora yegresii CBS 114405]EXJ60857.1 hypothetical protein A1O7_05010 [Cladophialophora yegresii CBS 114405]
MLGKYRCPQKLYNTLLGGSRWRQTGAESSSTSIQPLEHDPFEVESDGFEVSDVFTEPDDHGMVLYYDHKRFVLLTRTPGSREDGDIVSHFFLRVEKAEKDPDEMVFDRCLEDFLELVISICKHTMQASLEDFLHPTTFYLQYHIANGKLDTVEMDDVSRAAIMTDCVPSAVDFEPETVPILTPSFEIEFVKNLHMRKVVQVSKNGEVSVFKVATGDKKDQLKREIHILLQISETWELDHPCRPCVPRFLVS